MTDRELLEYAAKAAGITQIKWHESGEGGWLDGWGAPSTWWNPLRDDRDALRLAVKLGFEYGVIIQGDIESTRRAIVRAAAEIGKAT